MTPNEASQKYHWCKYDKDSNTVELYLDNFMLSGLRLCEAKFYLEHLLYIKPIHDPTHRKPWFFDFGQYLHWCFEQFYKEFKKNKKPPIIDIWLDECKMYWAVMKMDEYKDSIVKADVTKYEDVGGWEGVAGLLVQYYTFYMDMRIRVIDTEITFGHNKEVYLGQVRLCEGAIHEACMENAKIDCYLTGRIDLLVDNGYKIGPVDHKHTHAFDGYEHEDFNPHDGMTGYILAINEILKTYIMNGKIPICTGGWIYHISAKRPSTPRDKNKQQGPRFKTTPIDKTQEQLEDYKTRQLSTFKRVADLLFNNKVPEWNTQACNNIFHRQCEYKPIHEQPSSLWTDIINRFYTIGPAWDTRDHSNKETNSTPPPEEVKSGKTQL